MPIQNDNVIISPNDFLENNKKENFIQVMYLD